MTIYLDWNATSPRHPDVVAAIRRSEDTAWANPSSVHQAGRAARRVVEDTREQLASLLWVSPRDVVFTGGGTEANHLALSGARWLVTTRTEHPSITSQVEALAERGARVELAEVDEEGRVDLPSLDEAMSRCFSDAPRQSLDPQQGGLNNLNTPVVAISAVNHETGVIQPVEEIAQMVRARGARLHVDAVQLLGRGSHEILRNVDSLSVAAHKLRGPKGVGALAFACGWTPLPLGRGGAQERGLRPGTIDAAGLAGFSAALARLDESRRGYVHAGNLGRRFSAMLAERGRETALHGHGAERLDHVVNFRAQGWKGDELVAALDLAGICVSSGSACSAGTAEPSPVIQAMLGIEAARGAVRISFGEESTESDLDGLGRALERLHVLRSQG